MKDRILNTTPDKTYLIIRLMVGIIFLFEGAQKFLFPDLRGTGHFEQLGLPFPDFLSYSVASFEVICGAMVLAGLLTRVAVVPLLGIMIGAIFTTKLPILFSEGFWFMMYTSKIDIAMFLGCLFLLINGSGYWSADLRITKTGRD